MLENILIGVTSSLVASGIFLLFLYRLRPQIEISPFIAKESRPNGKIEYGFKFVNRTPYPLIDIKAKVRLRVAEVAPGGSSGAGLIWDSKRIAAGEIWQVAAYDPNDKNYDYAQRMTRDVDLEAEWDDSKVSELIFEVMARHSLSGFSIVASRKWVKKNGSIVVGTHNYGADLGVS